MQWIGSMVGAAIEPDTVWGYITVPHTSPMGGWVHITWVTGGGGGNGTTHGQIFWV